MPEDHPWRRPDDAHSGIESHPNREFGIGSAPGRVSPERGRPELWHPPIGSSRCPLSTDDNAVKSPVHATRSRSPVTPRIILAAVVQGLMRVSIIPPYLASQSALINTEGDRQPMVRLERERSGGPLRPSAPEKSAPALIPAGLPGRISGDGEGSGRRYRCMRWPRIGSRRRGCA